MSRFTESITKAVPTSTTTAATAPKNGNVKSLATCHISALRKMNAENSSRIGNDFIARLAMSPICTRS